MKRRHVWSIGGAALVLGAIAGAALMFRYTQAPAPPRRSGVTANGMEYAVSGAGPRKALFIPGGPGSEVQHGWVARLSTAQTTPYLRAGYTLHLPTRRRHMPAGHTVADMADDHADYITEQMGGHADVVIGESFGGMIALYLAANHPDKLSRLVLVESGARMTDEGRAYDVGWATAQAEGRYADVGVALLEMFLPGEAKAGLRRRLGPLLAPLFAKRPTPPEDMVVEARAEAAFDAREVLGRISAPVLIIAGDSDEFFPPEIVQETAAGIGDCTVITYPGKNHVGVGMSADVPRDVLDWLSAREEAHA